jgi:hypothetical protein
VVAKTGFDAVAAPVRALTIDHAAPPRTQGAGEKPPGKPRREVNGSARHGAIEISLPSGARVSVGAEADEAVLRLVLSAHEGAVMLQVAPGVRVYLACPQHGTSARRKMSGELGSRALERLAPFHSQNLRNSRILREARVLN